MLSWLVESWYFFYIPIHIAIGILSWAWFYYSVVKSIEEKFGVLTNEQLLRLREPKLLCAGYIIGAFAGPIALLSTISHHFFPRDGVKLRWGLRFL